MKHLPFIHALKLSLHGKWITRVITIVLSAFSFALFAFVTMGYTYNERDYIVRGYSNFLERTGFEYIYYTGQNELGRTYYTPEYIAEIEQRTGLSFARDYECKIELDRAGGGEYYEELGLLTAADEFGFGFLAGRAPETLYEIAVSECEFEYFHEYGYRNVRKNYHLAKDGKWEDGSPAYNPEVIGANFPCEDGYWYLDKECAVERIETPQDLIGKTIVVEYSTEKGILGSHGGATPELFEVEIVGVVDTGFDPSRFDIRFDSPTGRIFVSQEWEETFLSEKAPRSLFAPAPKDRETIAKCVDVALDLMEYAYRTTGSPLNLGLYRFIYLLSEFDLYPKTMDEFEDLFTLSGRRRDLFLLCGTGSIFAVLCIVLNAYLMTALLERSRKQIGILRSLGGSKKQIALIYLCGTLVMCFFIFLFALALLLGFYYRFVLRGLAETYIGVSRYVLTGWNVLILAGFCLVVPVLSVLIPLIVFMKRSCVEMIKDSVKGKKAK